jgi:hypothetical protein
MIYNENIVSEYGDVSGLDIGTAPIPYKPTPTSQDYSNGSITRVFAKKLNSNAVIEIQNQQVQNISTSLYATVSLSWAISGPKNNTYSGKIITNFGVVELNTSEINRVKVENGVDLSLALPNLLEYWRGN